MCRRLIEVHAASRNECNAVDAPFMVMRVARARCRRGFTALELLVAISVLGVLLAVLVPAVLQARSSSRSMECQMRLRQFGVAIHSFAATHRGLPPIAASHEGSRRRSTDAAAPHVELLQYVEQSGLERELSRVRPLSLAIYPNDVVSRKIRRLLTVSLPAFRCPSDDGAGRNNYVFCVGSVPVAEMASDGTGFWGDGAFPLIGSLPIARITDGLSNTAAVSERLSGTQNTERFDQRRDSWYSGADGLFTRPRIQRDELIRICDSANPAPADSYQFGGWTWAMSRFNTTCYNHCVPPNSSHNDCSTMARPEYGRIQSLHGIFKATSHHAGGVNQLLLDGAVRFVSNDIDVDVYRAIGTRNGSELPAGHDF